MPHDGQHPPRLTDTPIARGKFMRDCFWCGQRVLPGQPAVVRRIIAGDEEEIWSCRLHPECWRAAQGVDLQNEGDDLQDNLRGCSEDLEREGQIKVWRPDPVTPQEVANPGKFRELMKLHGLFSMVRFKTFTKKERARFIKEMHELVKEFPLIPEDSPFAGWTYTHRCQTKWGMFLFQMENTLSGMPTVFGRFVDTDRFDDTIKYLGANPHSGKWNVHQLTVDEAIIDFKSRMRWAEMHAPSEEDLVEWAEVEAQERIRKADWDERFKKALEEQANAKV